MNRYELSLRTKEENGLLLWTNKGKSLLGNFLAVAVVEGFPELSFNLGKQEDLVTVRSKVIKCNSDLTALLCNLSISYF